MSKAFKKEDGDEPEDESPELPGVDQGAKNYMTPVGFERLRAELKKLLYEDRPSLVQTISWAASNGDRSENGDYIYGKRRLREIDRRIRFLNRRLDSAEVIDPKTQKSDQALFGATVEVMDEDGKKKTYQIVGVDETEVRAGKISWISPIGKALLNHRVGDGIVLKLPRHGGDAESEVELEIVSIRYI